MLIKLPRKASKLFKLCAVFTTSLISLLTIFNLKAPNVVFPFNSFIDPLACPESPLLDDVLVVMRTGATEVLVKLPVQFQTVLKCVPDYIIYSDLEENVEGHHTFDVLDQISDDYRRSAPEFSLYNKLRESGREGLEYQTSFGSGPSGALDNPGWKLDKWKFLPMLDRALKHRPDAKWFVFIEPDTYMVWQNMLEYLGRFDPDEPHYIGTGMYIGEVLFAHGGSGFMISRPAMKMVMKYWKENKDWFDEYTAKEWAGDMVLGRAMKDAGVPLFSASPHLQGGSLTGLDWTLNENDKPVWCYAPLTFHHMTTREFHMVWKFEDAWLHYKKGMKTLRFRDIFNGVVQAHLRSERGEWDNMSTGTEYSDEAYEKLPEEDKASLSEEERKAQVSFGHCRAACESKPQCIQFSFVPRKCIISNKLRLGHVAESQCLEYSQVAGKCIRTGKNGAQGDVPGKESSVRSGWIMTRVVEVLEKMDQACSVLEGSVWAT